MTDPQLLRVQSIRVDRLFDLFDPRVDLKLAERVTILHGPNGVGKTMLLRMVNALLDGRYSLFQRVPFRRFALELTDDSRVELAPVSAKPSKKQRPLLRLILFRAGKEVDRHDVSANQDVLSMAEAVTGRFPWVRRIGDDLWTDDREPGLLSAEDIVSRYANDFPTRLRPEKNSSDPSWLNDLRSTVRVHLIEAQRLLRVTYDDPRRYRTGPRSLFTVLDYARDLKAIINDTMARYGQQSQSLDQSFPQRLLNNHTAMLPAAALKERMEKLDTRRAELKEIGLLDEPGSHPFDTAALDSLDAAQKSVMALYVEDTERKLSVLDDLARRARLLLDNVNRKFHHKRIRIDRELGLVAEGSQNRPLGLDVLSSGEQHELVLHYDLLFRVLPNTLVLIDEPELSLHPAWQKRFLPDLLEIVETAQFDVLMATHSPFIVGDRSDLMIGLGAELV